jgi:hypothetical protein
MRSSVSNYRKVTFPVTTSYGAGAFFVDPYREFRSLGFESSPSVIQDSLNVSNPTIVRIRGFGLLYEAGIDRPGLHPRH